MIRNISIDHQHGISRAIENVVDWVIVEPR
jgi:hypothetical protein